MSEGQWACREVWCNWVGIGEPRLSKMQGATNAGSLQTWQDQPKFNRCNKSHRGKELDAGPLPELVLYQFTAEPLPEVDAGVVGAGAVGFRARLRCHSA